MCLNIDLSSFNPLLKEEMKVMCIKDYNISMYDISLPPDDSIKHKTIFHKDEFYTIIKYNDWFQVDFFYNFYHKYDNINEYFITLSSYREMRINEIFED